LISDGLRRAIDQLLEIAFHEGASGRVFDLGTIERLLAEVKVLLAKEGPS
jgi:hypothetical protein